MADFGGVQLSLAMAYAVYTLRDQRNLSMGKPWGPSACGATGVTWCGNLNKGIRLFACTALLFLLRHNTEISSG